MTQQLGPIAGKRQQQQKAPAATTTTIATTTARALSVTITVTTADTDPLSLERPQRMPRFKPSLPGGSNEDGQTLADPVQTTAGGRIYNGSPCIPQLHIPGIRPRVSPVQGCGFLRLSSESGGNSSRHMLRHRHKHRLTQAHARASLTRPKQHRRAGTAQLRQQLQQLPPGRNLAAP